MPRPRHLRHICYCPTVRFYKPSGIPLRELEIIVLTSEELEALRLKNIENLDQNEAATQMHTSQSTFQRILASAYLKVSDALVNGRAIEID
jgi:predicted DNA-binding protein (UPF0251 family)